MALKSTIFKATLQLADIDHSYYANHDLTLARNPSETDERMMVRLVALALHAHTLQAICQGDGRLAFGAGLSGTSDPDVHLTDFTGRKRVWIEVGQPEERPLIKAASQTDSLVVYCYSPQALLWWQNIEGKLRRIEKLAVWHLPSESTQALSVLAERSMQLQATVMDSALTLSSQRGSVTIEAARWK